MDPNASARLTRTLVTQPNQETERLLRRASVQLDFARAFEPDSAEVAEATRIYEAGPTDLKAWVGEIEAALSPVGQRAKAYTVHLVGHGHIDMNWMWSWPETVSATHDTFASVISLMDEYPDLTYTQSQVAVYALTEKYHPALFEKIQRRVKEGRWEVSAVHWVEGDKNISSGESIARHLLYSRRYLKEKFGLNPEDAPVDWEPDTFGHANTIPTILAQGGVKYYYSCRTGGGHHHPRVGEERPPVFWWQGPDGARVLVNRETTWYNSYVNIGDNFALPMVTFARQTGLKNWLDVFGVGNHGGGPTRDEIDWFLEAREFPCYPTVKFSTAKAYFEAIEKEIADGTEVPVIDHELNYEFTGCYTSQSAIKKANRYGENYCEEAEALLTIDHLRLTINDGEESSIVNRKSSIQDAWLNVLFNQFHDILPGSGVAATRDHALGLFQETGAITGAIKRDALKSLTNRVDTLSMLPDTQEGREERERHQPSQGATFECGVGQGAGLSGFSVAGTSGRKHRFFPVVVYNPCAWERSEMVEVNLWDHDLDAGRIVALDADGRAVPTLVTYRSNNRWSDWQHHKTTLLFPAENIPALGYKTFLLCEGAPAADYPMVQPKPNEAFETPFLDLRFDRFEAGLIEAVDKRLRGRGLPEPRGMYRAGGLHSVVEESKGMTSWVQGTERYAGRTSATSFRIVGGSYNEGTGLPIGERFAYVVDSTFSIDGTSSTVRTRTLVQALSPRIDVECELDWREIGDAKRGIPGLILRTCSPHRGQDILCETPFGAIAREGNGHCDFPSLRFIHSSERFPTLEEVQKGYETELLEELGEAAQGVDLTGSWELEKELRTCMDPNPDWEMPPYQAVTLVQDCKYGFSVDGTGPNMRLVRSSFDPDHAPEVTKSTIRYSLIFHETPPTVAELTRLGAAWNHPLIVVPAGIQSGDLPASESYVQVLSESVVLSSLKLAEEGDGFVLRLVNYADEDVEAHVELNPALLGGRSGARTVDLIEQPTDGTAQLTGTRLTTTIPANSFVSVHIYGEAV